jgi:hypothetical protein
MKKQLASYPINHIYRPTVLSDTVKTTKVWWVTYPVFFVCNQINAL